MIKDKIESYRRLILVWYNLHKRNLPFRHTTDPYKIWLSEIMLQQTTMAVILDYYKRFVKRFPTVKSVAQATEHDLLTLWQGLGYYARIRNFQKACKIIVNDLGGQMPQTFDELKKLPGVGDYTAAAISSICFNEPRAVVDGNVKRVLARLFNFAKDITTLYAKKFFRDTAQSLLNPRTPGDFNQAIMELGALVCTPKQPACQNCPVQGHCLAFGNNPERLPIKKKAKWIDKQMNLLIAHSKTRVLLKKPTDASLVKGMWELPLQLKHLNTSALKHFPIKHTITNKRITARVISLDLSDVQLTKHARGDLKCIVWERLDRLPLSTLSRKALAHHLRRSS